ncbi:hypothetical protein FQR65_LT20171 [Abscondita terminalis]|nr:hypothetical protein FQR65_LT20171 [Abscondita terminalis]
MRFPPQPPLRRGLDAEATLRPGEARRVMRLASYCSAAGAGHGAVSPSRRGARHACAPSDYTRSTPPSGCDPATTPHGVSGPDGRGRRRGRLSAGERERAHEDHQAGAAAPGRGAGRGHGQLGPQRAAMVSGRSASLLSQVPGRGRRLAELASPKELVAACRPPRVHARFLGHGPPKMVDFAAQPGPRRGAPPPSAPSSTRAWSAPPTSSLNGPLTLGGLWWNAGTRAGLAGCSRSGSWCVAAGAVTAAAPREADRVLREGVDLTRRMACWTPQAWVWGNLARVLNLPGPLGRGQCGPPDYGQGAPARGPHRRGGAALKRAVISLARGEARRGPPGAHRGRAPTRSQTHAPHHCRWPPSLASPPPTRRLAGRPRRTPPDPETTGLPPGNPSATAGPLLLSAAESGGDARTLPGRGRAGPSPSNASRGRQDPDDRRPVWEAHAPVGPGAELTAPGTWTARETWSERSPHFLRTPGAPYDLARVAPPAGPTPLLATGD